MKGIGFSNKTKILFTFINIPGTRTASIRDGGEISRPLRVHWVRASVGSRVCKGPTGGGPVAGAQWSLCVWIFRHPKTSKVSLRPVSPFISWGSPQGSGTNVTTVSLRATGRGHLCYGKTEGRGRQWHLGGLTSRRRMVSPQGAGGVDVVPTLPRQSSYSG